MPVAAVVAVLPVVLAAPEVAEPELTVRLLLLEQRTPVAVEDQTETQTCPLVVLVAPESSS